MVAIKGIEMPNRCDECQCAVGSECPFLRIDVEEEMGSRDMNCPLVEIITCENCKYYRNKGNKYSYCTKRLNVDSITDRYREPNFYCADAERKGGEE